MTSIRPSLLPILLLMLMGAVGSPTYADDQATTEHLEFFEKEVRPLLAKHCYQCHSTTAKRVEASLLLDTRAAHMQGGDSGAAIVPGDADNSLLIEAVRYESYEMPPKGKLPDRDIEVLVRWVELGAPWPEEAAPDSAAPQNEFDLEKRKSEFWVWQPIADNERPKVADLAWPYNDIDHYILARLEEADLKPARDAERTAILRRLYFDLIGLPPTPDEVEAFLQDCELPRPAEGGASTSAASPKASGDNRPEARSGEMRAISTVVDRLLDSPHFGERWGRHWLDLVRYAESRGHEFDNDTPNAFQYRDYVIRALNADVPYDQFVREHIAGDLLPTPRLHPTKGFNESVLGTGFWFLGEWVHSPVDIRKDEADRFDNMLDVMSKTFLGVTVACARCHDHKFDAISTADYYSLSGFLQSSDYRQVRFESIEQNRRIAQQLARVDARYRREIEALLHKSGIRLPAQDDKSVASSHGSDETPPADVHGLGESLIVDFANLPTNQYLQDGFIFGPSPRRAGQVFLSSAEELGESHAVTTRVNVASFGAAVSDPFWAGLESVTEGHVQNKSAIAKLPKSGRTLRSPTFELKNGNVSCLVDGEGHIVACVDSHRLVAGPLHKQTVVPVKPGQRWVTLNLTRYIGHRLHLEFIPAKDAQMAVRIITQGLDAKQLSALDQRLAASDQRYEAYAQAVESLLNGGPKPKSEERVFADFESGTYDDWTVTGEAFGTIPQTLETIAPYQGRINGRGKFFVNSHNIRPGGDVAKGDRLTGTLTSPEFMIDFESIEFLVGGGTHVGKTCVNLIVDGKTELSVTGKAANQMSLNTWDVRPFIGKRAKIQVVDNHQSGWGNIGIDHIVFKSAGSPHSRKQHARKGHQDARQKNPETLDEIRNVIASKELAAHELAAHKKAAMGIVRAWQQERAQLAAQVVRSSRVAPAMIDGTSEDDRILIRGNSSKPGEVEPRHFLTAIAGNSPMSIDMGSGRLELAEQINDPRNPLASRVIVNRIWHHLMGRGIVPTVDDFGFLGQRPTHPELLDHLATRFNANGRSIKRLIKYIVLSRTYQLSSYATPQAMDADPNNLLWHHCPPRRLQGEVIRDALLALSERLDSAPYGPPVPIHLTSFMDGRGRPSKSGPLDGAGRRSIYVAVRRNFLSPFMLTFDTPVPFSSMGRRNVSNVPAQALILLNDPLVDELSRKWGERALETVPESGTTSVPRRVAWMYLSGFGRRPTTEETEIAVAFVESQADKYGVTTEDPNLWAKFAHVLVNTKEFIYLR